MNEKLKHLIYYILNENTYNLMSIVRLERMVYISEWVCAFNFKHFIVEDEWYNGPNGPKNDRILQCLKQNNEIFELHYKDIDGEKEYIDVKLVGKLDSNLLSDSEKQVVKFIYINTKDMDYLEFSNFTNHTFPIEKNAKYSNFTIMNSLKKYDEVYKTKV